MVAVVECVPDLFGEERHEGAEEAEGASKTPVREARVRAVVGFWSRRLR